MRPFDHLHFFLKGLTLVCNLAKAGIRKRRRRKEVVLASGLESTINRANPRLRIAGWTRLFVSVELLEPLPTDGQGQKLLSPPRPGAPSRPMWPITFGIAIRRVSRRSAGLKYGRATGKTGMEGGWGGGKTSGKRSQI